MKNVFQSGGKFFVTAFSLMLASAFLTGCPKKVAPLGKGSRGLSEQSGPSSGKIGKPDERLERGNLPLTEEEIPSIVRLEEEKLEPPIPEVPQEKSDDLSSITDILFDFGQWTIRSMDVALLEQNAGWLAAHPDAKIELEGHADPRGTNEYNLILGEKRANAVQEYLVQLGLDQTRFLVISYGEERPFCNEEDEACYQENRRVHFRVE